MISPYLILGKLLAVLTLTIAGFAAMRCRRKRYAQKLANQAKSRELARRL